ncbi:MAG TPA: phosphatase PAP2 family protein [Sediminibacterium sp.]
MALLTQFPWPWLEKIDKWLFLKVNTEWTCGFLDSIMPWWREANAWVPLYLFLVVFGLINFRKRFWFWLLFIIITLVFTDQLSSTLVKKTFMRVRPCADESLAGQMRLLLNHCSGGFSFTSSHAANHFGFAVFLTATLKQVFGKWRYLFLLWAATVSYGQVYVGVHYPLDIFCGALLGCLAGWITSSVYLRHFGDMVPLEAKQ